MKYSFLLILASFIFVVGCEKDDKWSREETLIFDKQVRPENSIVVSVEDIPHTDLCKVFIKGYSCKLPLTVSKKTKPKVGDTVEVLQVFYKSEVYGQSKKFFTIKTE